LAEGVPWTAEAIVAGTSFANKACMPFTNEFFIRFEEVNIFPHTTRMVSFVAAPGRKKSDDIVGEDLGDMEKGLQQ